MPYKAKNFYHAAALLACGRKLYGTRTHNDGTPAEFYFHDEAGACEDIEWRYRTGTLDPMQPRDYVKAIFTLRGEVGRGSR